jgi:hypothetical protein
MLKRNEDPLVWCLFCVSIRDHLRVYNGHVFVYIKSNPPGTCGLKVKTTLRRCCNFQRWNEIVYLSFSCLYLYWNKLSPVITKNTTTESFRGALTHDVLLDTYLVWYNCYLFFIFSYILSVFTNFLLILDFTIFYFLFLHLLR